MFRSIIFGLIVFSGVFGAAFAQGDAPTAVTDAKSAPQDNALAKSFADFSFDLPNATWRAASKADDATVEVINGDRLDGYLQIRKVTTNEDANLADVIDREQNQKLQFLPGFVNGKEETFKGALSGRVVNYEFTQSGKPMIGRVYFLEADNRTVYVLRFTGLRDKLKLIRNQTDSIARTFKLKAAK